MRQWFSERLDDAMLPFLKLINRGYHERLPAFRSASACDSSMLHQIGQPADIRLLRERDWRGCRSERFSFTSPAACLPVCKAPVSGRLLTVRRDAPWCLIVPGYATGALPASGYSFYQTVQARALAEHGVNAALIDTPFHMSRRSPGCLSGEGFFSPDLQQTKQSVLQGAAESISLLKWLADRSGRKPGMWGTSLGGGLAGLAAAHYDGVGALVLMEPLDNPGDPLAVLPGSAEIRAAAGAAGVPPEMLPAALRDVAPSQYPPLLDPGSILFITPIWDRVVHPDFQEAFWAAWGRPERLLVRSSHTTMANDRRVAHRAAEFLAARLSASVH